MVNIFDQKAGDFSVEIMTKRVETQDTQVLRNNKFY
jgi:hypothetical protein